MAVAMMTTAYSMSEVDRATKCSDAAVVEYAERNNNVGILKLVSEFLNYFVTQYSIIIFSIV